MEEIVYVKQTELRNWMKNLEAYEFFCHAKQYERVWQAANKKILVQKDINWVEIPEELARLCKFPYVGREDLFDPNDKQNEKGGISAKYIDSTLHVSSKELMQYILEAPMEQSLSLSHQVLMEEAKMDQEWLPISLFALPENLPIKEALV